MLTTSVLLILTFCGLVNSTEWWQTGPIYQIYPASFADSNGDGIGDLKGIESHVNHFTNIGVAGVWLSPIFASPMQDNGYDISSYVEINPMFGTMNDFQDLVTALHDKDIKIMLDLVPNHTSNESQWFIDSAKQSNYKDDWYVWMDSKGVDSDGNQIPPNNWESIFGGSAWEYNTDRGQFYLHQFATFQPDLNYSNPRVITEMQNIMRFWLAKGVDGFRVDAVPYIVETHYDLDEPVIADCTPPDSYQCLDHIYTKDQDGTYSVLDHFATVLLEPDAAYSRAAKIQFVEAYTTLNNTMRYYSNLTVPFNFAFITGINQETNATTLQNLTRTYLNALPVNAWPNWVTGNHDNPRVGTRLGESMIDAMNMLQLLLPGTPVTYNGEEIGMTDGYVRADQRKDPTSGARDPCRTPMQWNSSANAGFSTNLTNPYLPVNPNYWQVNVDSESSLSSDGSHMNVYKMLVAINQELAGSTSTNLTTAVYNDWIFAFFRDPYLVVINLNNELETLSLNDLGIAIGSQLKVKIPSINSPDNALRTNTMVTVFDQITLFPRSGVVFAAPSSASSLYQISTSLVTSLVLFSAFFVIKNL